MRHRVDGQQLGRNTGQRKALRLALASALLELSRYTNKTESKRYWNAGADALASLAGPAYRAKEGENNNFILMHSTGSMPGNSEIDVPLSYADYYFIEGLLRYKQWSGK